MKPILGLVALVGFFGRCDQYVPHTHPDPWWHDSEGSDAGSQQADAGSSDAGVTECDASSVDAQVIVPADAAVTNDEPCVGPPGLFVEGSCKTPQPGLRSYRPEYELWTDGASKQRFIFLPPGAQIDTSNPDRWAFPLGTRVYKTFSVGGKRIETRVLEKIAAPNVIESWTMTAYAWSEDQRSVAVADPAGVQNALGTNHDIPSAAQCKTCHSMTALDAINGFGAIQLNHPDPAGITLQELIAHNRLLNVAGTTPNVTLENARIPGDEIARNALGYLHGNCGTCHGGPTPRAGLALWSTVGTASVAEAQAVKTGACMCLTRWGGRKNPAGDPYTLRVDSGHAALSGVIGRMRVRGSGEQMPPLGTEMVDEKAVAKVSAWIDALDPMQCANTPACPPPLMPGAGGAGASRAGSGAPAAGAAAPASTAAGAPAVAGPMAGAAAPAPSAT